MIWPLLLACLLTFTPTVWAANTHNLGSQSREQAAWFGDMMQPHAVSGCVPAVPASTLLIGATACQAYVRATTGELVYVAQAASTIGPLSGGDGTYWLAVHRDTSSTVELVLLLRPIVADDQAMASMVAESTARADALARKGKVEGLKK